MRLIKRLWAKRFWRWCIILGVFFCIFNVAALYVTSTNWFCGNACHIMETYNESWQASQHKDVDCVACHIPPGVENVLHAKLNGMGQLIDDLLGRTSGKPSAAVSDFSCTRSGCHDLEEIRDTKITDNRYLFRHDRHLEKEYSGIEIHCTTCHSHIQGKEHFEVNTNACVVCHLMAPADPMIATRAGQGVAPLRRSTTRPGMPAGATASTGSVGGVGATTKAADWAGGFPTTSPADGKPTSRCQECHQAPTEPVESGGLQIVHSDYTAYGAACESCHIHVTAARRKVEDTHCFGCHDFGLERMESVEQVHRKHSASGHKKVECFSCHGVIKHGPVAQAMRLDVIDCRSCHQAQHSVQQTTYRHLTEPLARPGPSSAPSTGPANGAATRPVEDLMVTPMFLAHVHCTGCHVQQKGLGAKPGAGATVAVATAESCDRCHESGLGKQMVPMWQRSAKQYYGVLVEMRKAISPGETGRAAQLVAEAERLLDLVRLDGSWGVHNPRYTSRLLDTARQKLVEARSLTPGALKGSK